MEWQPIKTAPKNQIVLLLLRGGGMISGRNSRLTFSDDSYRWITDTGQFGDDFLKQDPVSWMPRPAPPRLPP